MAAWKRAASWSAGRGIQATFGHQSLNHPSFSGRWREGIINSRRSLTTLCKLPVSRSKRLRPPPTVPAAIPAAGT